MKIYLSLFLLLPLLTIAQTEIKTIYVNDSYHNRNCFGGTGICSETTIELSKEKTTASVSKISDNQLEITLDKRGFTAKDWEELMAEKIFTIEKNTSLCIDEFLLKKLAFDTKYKLVKPLNYPVIIKNDKAYFILELTEH